MSQDLEQKLHDIERRLAKLSADEVPLASPASKQPELHFREASSPAARQGVSPTATLASALQSLVAKNKQIEDDAVSMLERLPLQRVCAPTWSDMLETA